MAPRTLVRGRTGRSRAWLPGSVAIGLVVATASFFLVSPAASASPSVTSGSPPTVTGVSPSSGPATGGTAVTVTGTNFTGATAVDFGSDAATNVVVSSDSSISAVSPAGSDVVDVTVTSPGGTSTTNKADEFTFLPVGRYYPLSPERILDTRNGTGGHTGPLGPGGSLDLPVTGFDGIPAGAAAVVMNVTATDTTASSFLTVWPEGATRPTASNLNFVAGQTVANLVEVALGDPGRASPGAGPPTPAPGVSIFNDAGSADVVADVEGYVAPAKSTTDTAGLFNPLSPTRILDTRGSTGGHNGPLGPGASLELQVTGEGGVPSSGVSAVVLNVTATDTSASSFLTVWPEGATRPTASNLNFTAGQTLPNRVMVPVSASGQVSIYNDLGTANVIVDLGGYFTDGTNPSAAGDFFTPAPNPVRILDTRGNIGHSGAIGPNSSISLAVAGSNGIPSDATAAVANTTATDTSASSFLTVYPDGTSRPTASDLNWSAGQTVANLVVTQLGADKSWAIYNNQGTTDAIADVAGWYEPFVSGCDPLDPTSCLLPFPDDFYTVPDASTPTGLRVDFPGSAMPRNSLGVPIDPTQWNLNDGFSPGTPILLHVPGIDLAKTGAAPITNIGASLDANAPIVVIDTVTGKRAAYWAELDANDTNPNEQALIIRPDAALLDGHRYIVAISNPRDSSGNIIQPNPVFRAYRDDLPLTSPAENARRAHMNSIFAYLTAHGVSQSNLYLAWDFTVASQQSLTGRLLHMRDEAFANLGSAAPSFTVTSVTNYTTAQDPRIARHIEGTFDVPSYLNAPGGPPGSTLNLGPDGLPTQIPGNIQTANFSCNVPRAAVADATDPNATVYPGHAMLYGHGLLGNANEINDPNIENMANEHNFVTCGTNWLGLSDQDVLTDLAIVQNLSLFPSLPDRGQQAMLDFLFLGRLMTSPTGFDTNAAFEAGASHPVIDQSNLYYYGNSQGGIYGGTLTAVSQEFTRAVLGVPAMNYSLLLNRSVDFAPFLAVLNTTYPDKLTQQIGFGLMQMLWDRSDPDGYAEFMTSNPLPGTPPHEVLMDEAFGDHQVANIGTENEARTIGATVHEPALAPGRSPDVVPMYGIPPTPSDVYQGSALVMWDSGTPAPPTTNTPPTAGADPHGVPRAQPTVRYQDAAFLLSGVVLNVCGASPCMAVPAGG